MSRPIISAQPEKKMDKNESGPGDKICSVDLRVCHLLTIITITLCVNRAEEQRQSADDDSLARGQAACTNALQHCGGRCA